MPNSPSTNDDQPNNRFKSIIDGLGILMMLSLTTSIILFFTRWLLLLHGVTTLFPVALPAVIGSVIFFMLLSRKSNINKWLIISLGLSSLPPLTLITLAAVSVISIPTLTTVLGIATPAALFCAAISTCSALVLNCLRKQSFTDMTGIISLAFIMHGINWLYNRYLKAGPPPEISAGEQLDVLNNSGTDREFPPPGPSFFTPGETELDNQNSLEVQSKNHPSTPR